MEKKVNVVMDNSNNAFYASQVTVHHSSTDFCLDFGQLTPRTNFTPEGGEISYVNKHETILLHPVMAKQMYSILGTQIEKFEKDNGAIVIPKPEEQKKEDTDTASTKYIG